MALLSGASRGDARDVQGRERATAPEPEAAQSSTEASSRPGEHASTSQAAQRSLVSGPGEVLRRLELRPVPAPAEFGSEATHTRLANIAAVDLQARLTVERRAGQLSALAHDGRCSLWAVYQVAACLRCTRTGSRGRL